VKALLIVALGATLAGCTPLEWQIGIAGISYIASVNNVGASYLKWTDDQDLVCPVALTPMQRCPVKAVHAP
jgi:hypothetical protein